MSVILVEPPAPRCNACGHIPCPCCVEWCDVVSDTGLCCDGECSYADGDWQAWQLDRERMADWQPYNWDFIEVAQGPFLPHTLRESRNYPKEK